jgi:hypothetical protein
MLACAVWSIACAMLRSPSRNQSLRKCLRMRKFQRASERSVIRGVCGVVMIWDGKDYYPKLTPKTFGCAKVPSAAAVELRRCAHRPRELSLSKARPGSRECTLDSRVRRARRLITLPTAWSRIHLIHLHRYFFFSHDRLV